MIFGTFEKDRAFLTGKFRNPEFPEQPGLSNQELSKAAEIREMEIRDQKAEAVKAELFEFICSNMLIDVNPHDFFVSFGCCDRMNKPMAQMIANRIEYIYDTKIPEERKRMDQGYLTGTKTMWFDTDHSVPDWDFLLENGFPGVQKRLEYYRKWHRDHGSLDADKECLFDSVRSVYCNILKTIKRFRDFGSSRYPENKRVAMVCASLQRLEQ